MAKEVTLGGDRLGSGHKQTQEIHNYGYNSFNLEQDWKSSMAPGILYPFLKLVGTTHDYFDIDLDSFVRTLPTKGPLFGSFKLQLDLFSIPFRLYQGIIHNNPIDLGMKMNQVYIPKLEISTTDGPAAARLEGSNNYNYQINESSLCKYMGLSGLGKRADSGAVTAKVARKINAVPFLAYYDIFKNYYSNKQEENAYVISPGAVTPLNLYIKDSRYQYVTAANPLTTRYVGQVLPTKSSEIYEIPGIQEVGDYSAYSTKELYLNFQFNIKWDNTDTKKADILQNIEITITVPITGNLSSQKTYTLESLIDDYGALETWTGTDEYTALSIRILKTDLWTIIEDIVGEETYVDGGAISLYTTMGEIQTTVYSESIQLVPFKLKNIDDMRNALLSANTLGQEFTLGLGNTHNWNEESGTDGTGLPYSTLFNVTEDDEITYNAFESNGLLVKTYQSDLFQNWLDSEWIDGENGISAISAVDTSSGSFTMDSLNLAEKIYELLNRILVSGGTYQDWQEAVYGEGVVRKCETPMYIGGMSAEVMFEEVISSSETNVGDGEGLQPLGSLGGKGTQMGKKGGNNIHCKLEEESYIIGIVSLTPRISYNQGNDWDLTELDSMDDFHKPELDGIGFQDLIVEQMAWWNTVITPGGNTPLHRDAAGKQTAWINYQTAVDKSFGDFAREKGTSFMVLNRNYEQDGIFGVKDLTTYIDPAKYNYAFAVTDLAAQNFWVQIHSKVVARRKMGAQQLPNL